MKNEQEAQLCPSVSERETQAGGPSDSLPVLPCTLIQSHSGPGLERQTTEGLCCSGRGAAESGLSQGRPVQSKHPHCQVVTHGPLLGHCPFPVWGGPHPTAEPHIHSPTHRSDNRSLALNGYQAGWGRRERHRFPLGTGMPAQGQGLPGPSPPGGHCRSSLSSADFTRKDASCSSGTFSLTQHLTPPHALLTCSEVP